ncbi:MAG: GntR family transcriptional regulator [Nitrospiraceae bacterium]|nr:GntR family transcriptional regulator [Nitrospiraceae bacterium]
MEQEGGIPRDSISNRVKKWISERILNGTYPPGHRLVELQIAHELKTSQGPVREALRELEASGLVESEPFKGTRVRQVSAREMQEAYQVRAFIEQHAAELAAFALRDNTSRLQSEIVAAHEAAEKGDIETFTRHKTVFHRQIVEASGNSILLRFWDALQFEIRSQVILSQEKFSPLEGEKLHQAIIDAFRNGNGKLAGRLLRKHLLGFADTIDSTHEASWVHAGRKSSTG